MAMLPTAIAALVDAAADKYAVPRPLARAIAWTESRGNPLAKGKAGEMGVMQLMPATAKALGVVDAFDAGANIDAGVKYLAQLLSRYGERAGVAAYNWGPGNVSKHTDEKAWPQQVLGYVATVLQRAQYELATMNTQPSGSPSAAPPLAQATRPRMPSQPPSRPSVLPPPPQPDGGDDDA